MSTRPDDLARQLHDLHVQWFIRQLEGEALAPHLGMLLDGFLRDAEELTLNAVTTAEAIQATVRKYAGEMQLGGEIPALVGDIARRLYSHKIHRQTRLEDLIPDQVFEEFLDKCLELKSLREELVELSVTNPIFERLISDLLRQAIRDYAQRTSRVTDRLPGGKMARKVGQAVVARTQSRLPDNLEENLQKFFEQRTRASLRYAEQQLTAALDRDDFRELVLDYWHQNKSRKVSAVQDYAGSLDLEEIFVIAYEYWQDELRHSDFIRSLIDAGIETFFEQFGDYTLRELLEAIGLDRDMMLDDGLRFAPPAIAALQEHGLLEGVVSRVIGGFYHSEELNDVLKNVGA